MKILALDLGYRRSGIAVSEEKFIFGRGTICGWEDWQSFISTLKTVINKEKVNKIVVGIPHSASGEAAQKTREVINKIKKSVGTMEIEEVDETLSTKEAQRRTGNKEDDNEEAAKILLEDYINKLT